MFRYIAFAWDSRDPRRTDWAQELVRRARAQSTPWRTAVDCIGLVVLFAHAAAHSEPIELARGQGVILGTLFPHAALAETEADRILASGGQHLIEHYWGDYVAVLREERTANVRVLRGPASALPCLHVETSNVSIYFSSMESCAQLNAKRFSIDWIHVARTLHGPFTSEQTDIREVREILPGTCDVIRRDSVTNQRLWNPAAIAGQSHFEHIEDAARALREVTSSCVDAWASRFPSILVGLSGGLDSSITLACLSKSAAKPRVVCLTQFTDDFSSDERPFARLAATRAGCELIEYRRDAIVDLKTAQYSVRMETSPGLRIPSIDRIEPEAANRLGAQAVFHGEGGDELFCRNGLSLYVADYLRECGIRRDLPGLLMHAAASEGVTVWQALLRAAWNAAFPSRNFASHFSEGSEATTPLSSELIAQWLAEPATTPTILTRRATSPGRQWQIGLISARRAFYGPFTQADDPINVSPFLSQPLIELCLRKIPTWLQMAGRRDRAVARVAFASDLPEQIGQRREKGAGDSLAAAILARNLDFVRELLLDGIVIQQGIVDRPRLEAALTDTPSNSAIPPAPLFEIIGAELWARAWAGNTASSDQNEARTPSK